MPKRYELPDLRPRDLVRLTNPEGGESLMYLNAQGRGHWVHFRDSRTLGRLTRPGAGWDLRDHEGNYTELGRLRDVDEHIVADAERWPELEASLRAAGPLTSPKIGDVLTREQVAALPAGAVTQDLDTNATWFVEQWDGHGRGRVIGVSTRRLPERLDPDFGERPRPARLVALGTPMNDRKAVYQSLADQGFKPAIEVLASVSKSEPARETKAPVEISATGTMVQVGDMVETTEETLTALPPGAVVHLWDPDQWSHQALQTERGLRWLPSNNTACPWNIPGRQAVVVALGCPDFKTAVRARDAFLARPYKGQEREAALAAYLEGKVSTEVKAALDTVSNVGLNDQTISAVSGAVDRAFKGFATDDFVLPPETTEMRRREEWFNKIFATRPPIGYREPMPEIKPTMKLDLKTETLSVDVPRLPGESDNAYAARASALVKPQTNAVADNVMLQAQPSWLERAAEALKPVASELAAEAKAQTRQAIALGGVEVARVAMHKGIAAAADALAPQHAAKVVQVTQHPVTRWLENAALFLGARAAGKPALAQVGLREVVKAPMEGAAGLLVQAASQVVGAVKGALVAADEAARAEQVTGQPEAAQVSAGEVRS